MLVFERVGGPGSRRLRVRTDDHDGRTGVEREICEATVAAIA